MRLIITQSIRVTVTGAALVIAALAGQPAAAQDENETWPVLGASHGRSVFVEHCEGKPDDTPLPLDPRTLIRPGVNEGRAVMFNAFHEDCHVDHPNRRSKTCGEFRERAARGWEYLAFGYPSATSGITAEQYEGLWRVWGLSERPANIDAEIRERYGLAEAPYHNPYPRPGEDPNATAGGNGQLPLGLAQIRNPDGTYTGEITTNCFVCHQGQVGRPAADGGPGGIAGLGGHNVEFMTQTSEFIWAQFNGIPANPPFTIPLSSNRGTTNAEGLSELLFLVRDIHSLDPAPGGALRLEVFHPNGGDTDMPAWWNLSHRPRKFWEGGMSSDGGRMAILLWYAASAMNGAQIRAAVDQHEMDVLEWFDTLEAPVWPFEVDTRLAEQGATIFHKRDLWAGDDNPVERPAGGNGSCASCHGVYSPRYANDPDFLEDPRLAGIAAYVSPLEEIGTDPRRIEGMPSSLRKALSVSWLSYPEGKPGYVAPADKDPFTEWIDDYQFALEPYGVESFAFDYPYGACGWDPEREKPGYQATQLHGVWATAPYFHNGSVPDVWGVLDPSSRPKIWRRHDSGAGTHVEGFDSSLAAIDPDRLGWRHDVLTCDPGAGVPYLSCDPGTDEADPVARAVLSDWMGATTATYVSTPTSNETLEQRKIFNTLMYGKSSSGHEFTAVLREEERRALIEYLKTL